MNGKKTISFSLIGLSILIFTLTFVLNRLDDNDDHQNPVPVSERRSQSAPYAKATADQAEKQPPMASPDKIEMLKKSDALDMSLVDESLREYILSLYFEFRNASGKEEFIACVKSRLMKDFPSETAKEILKIYEAYIDCEFKLQEQLTTYDEPKNEEDMFIIANDIFEFRKLQMGDELAEKLFGQEHRVTIYKILNRKIHEDDSLYGAEKEMQLRLLAAEIFGDNADENVYDKTGESLFYEKMALYKKDFEEMTKDEKKAKVREFRSEYLTAEEIEQVETAEARVAANREKNLEYNDRKNVILNDPNLSDEEKQNKIRSLQDNVFGDRAEEIRRGEEFARQHNENMQKALQNCQTN